MFALSVYMHKHHNRFGTLARDISSVKTFIEIMDYHGSTAPFSRKNHQEVKHWSTKLQGKKGDCLPKGFVFELPNMIYPKIPNIKRLGELKTIWDSWTAGRQSAFTTKYGDIALLLTIDVTSANFRTILR